MNTPIEKKKMSKELQEKAKFTPDQSVIIKLNSVELPLEYIGVVGQIRGLNEDYTYEVYFNDGYFVHVPEDALKLAEKELTEHINDNDVSAMSLDPNLLEDRDQKIVKVASKTGGLKADGGKPRMDLLPSLPLESIAQVLTFGAEKYDAHNWRKGIEFSRVYGALQRHLAAFNEGEDIDPESGLHHLAHAGCNILFLLEFAQRERYKALDDRYNPLLTEGET